MIYSCQGPSSPWRWWQYVPPKCCVAL